MHSPAENPPLHWPHRRHPTVGLVGGRTPNNIWQPQYATCLIWDVSPTIRAKLPAIAVNEADAIKLVAALLDADSAAAYQAMARLAGSPKSAIMALRTILKPVPMPNVDEVATLIGKLDSPQFAVRDQAAARLTKIGDGVEGSLRKALEGKLSAEARDRIEKLLAELKPSQDRLRQGRRSKCWRRLVPTKPANSWPN